MTKLEKLYSTIKNLEELGIELPADVLKQTAELEESLIKKEILPVVRQQIEPVLCNIQRDLTFVVDYVPGVPVRVRISRKAGIYDNNDFIELTPIPKLNIVQGMEANKANTPLHPDYVLSEKMVRLFKKDSLVKLW